jgi:preprotein translocase subunit SecY
MSTTWSFAWKRLRSLWTMADLRNKILFTLGLLLVYRVLAHILVPLTHQEQVNLINLFGSNKSQNLGQLLGLLDVFSGGSLQTFSIVALGLAPYITATIVMQLLQPIIPALRDLSTQGEAGRLRLSQIMRMITIPLAFLQALGQSAIFVRAGVLDATTFNLFGPNWLETLSILLSLTTGTMILVWIGELITEHGIGNGISLIIFAGIVSHLPQLIQQGFLASISSGGNGSGIVSIAVFLLIGLLTIMGIVLIYQAQRRVPVRHPTKRAVGHGMLAGSSQTSYLPMQVNSTGMIPLIFAQSFLIFPALLSQYLVGNQITWLSSAARSTVADYWRTHYRLPANSLDELLEAGWEGPAEEEPAVAAISSGPADRVQHLLQALPEQYREVLICRFLLNLSIKATALRMGLTEANIKVLQFRALKRAATLEQVVVEQQLSAL